MVIRTVTVFLEGEAYELTVSPGIHWRLAATFPNHWTLEGQAASMQCQAEGEFGVEAVLARMKKNEDARKAADAQKEADEERFPGAFMVVDEQPRQRVEELQYPTGDHDEAPVPLECLPFEGFDFHMKLSPEAAERMKARIARWAEEGEPFYVDTDSCGTYPERKTWIESYPPSCGNRFGDQLNIAAYDEPVLGGELYFGGWTK
jgi:hypothetical protein